jgi:hypothetical protein
LSQQTSVAYQSEWDDELQCWTGDPKGVETSVAADRVYRKPVLNTENGYEYLANYPTNRKQVYHADTVRRAAWRIVCAGGYFAAGFVSTLGHSDAWERIDAPNRYPFLVKDSGASAQLSYLYDFFAPLPYWRMTPMQEIVQGDALCLAEPGAAYVIYLPHGGEIILDLPTSGQEFASRWFDPREGRFYDEETFIEKRKFVAPDDDDWILLVERSTPRKNG